MLAIVNLDIRVPPDHHLRTIKQVADDVLSRMSDYFVRIYSRICRASVPLERLLKSPSSGLPVLDTQRDILLLALPLRHEAADAALCEDIGGVAFVVISLAAELADHGVNGPHVAIIRLPP